MDIPKIFMTVANLTYISHYHNIVWIKLIVCE
jgi:hypothetical protein